MTTRLPPNAYTLVDDFGDSFLHPYVAAFPTLAEAEKASKNTTLHPGRDLSRPPRVVACWAYVDIHGRVTTSMLPKGTMGVNYGPESSDPWNLAWRRGEWSPDEVAGEPEGLEDGTWSWMEGA